jgi:uncharacterized protein (TIGR03067 family)
MVSLVLACLLGAPVTRSSACTIEPLRGSWIVTALTFDGKPWSDDEMLGARLTFAADRLKIDTARQERTEFALRVETGARPCAFHLAPLGGSGEPPGWMLFAMEGNSLRLGFHDNLSRRAASFDARPDMLVLSLARPADPR